MRPGTKARMKLTGGLLLCLFVVSVQSSLAQRLDELARQTRERRAGQLSPSKRVYTNEDLARPRILEPQDPAPLRAVPPAPPVRRLSPPVQWPAEVSLGEVARYYRSLKQLRETPEFSAGVAPPDKPALAPWAASKPALVASPASGVTKIGHRAGGAAKQDPVLPARDRVRVRRGDSLWKLAVRHMGSGEQWRDIAAVNPDVSDPHRIRAGQWLRLPQTASVAAMRQVRVKEGDSLWKLARMHFGTSDGWSCIAAANPQVLDANRIYPGQPLAIPARCPATT